MSEQWTRTAPELDFAYAYVWPTTELSTRSQTHVVWAIAGKPLGRPFDGDWEVARAAGVLRSVARHRMSYPDWAARGWFRFPRHADGCWAPGVELLTSTLATIEQLVAFAPAMQNETRELSSHR